MTNAVRTWRPQNGYDWAVVGVILLVVAHLTATALLWDSSAPFVVWSGAVLGIGGCVVFMLWMAYGHGANSPLWQWLPPFYPWGAGVKAAWARWAIVVALFLGTIIGTMVHLSRLGN